MEESVVPVLTMPRKPDFLVIGGKTFFLEDTALSPEDLFKRMTEFYEDSLEALKDKVATHCSQEAKDDLNHQLARIERHVQRGVVVLPDECRDSGNVVMVYANKAYPTRIMLFRPTRLSVVLSRVLDWVGYVKRDISRKDAERYSNFMAWAEPLVSAHSTVPPNGGLSSIKVDITINQDVI